MRRNSSEPYTIKLSLGKSILTAGDINDHIDNDTLSYKFWHYPELRVLTKQGDELVMLNSCNSVRHILTIVVEDSQLYVTCSCNKKVDKLCHHVYYALKHIIAKEGTHFFRSIL